MTLWGRCANVGEKSDMRLEDLQTGVVIRGVLPKESVTVVGAHMYGTSALELTYKTQGGRVANEVFYREDEKRLAVERDGCRWRFDGDGVLFRLVSEAQRIRRAYAFDPRLAVHTSSVDPLPHQITAVYESMLPRHPLRFLLADDPGAGKTIMAGLLMKELVARGDLLRCLVVCPGNLVEQWQDELWSRFELPFEIMTNDKLESARTGNWFLEANLVIARLDKLARDEGVKQKLKEPDSHWDLIVCDEAHKMAGTVWGNKVKYTKRYRLGELLSGSARHFLLMTATPHSGKEADFHLFMRLLDEDRFAGRYREGTHGTDVSDLMRRMVKEDLLKFDGRPLFPERIAHTIPYKLSEEEAHLYKSVTEYVRTEFNRAEELTNDGRTTAVGFALTVLQRRLASSPEAIYQSLCRRHDRLERKLRDGDKMYRDNRGRDLVVSTPGVVDAEFIEDLEEMPDQEAEAMVNEIVDQATAARSIAELKAETQTLKSLVCLAHSVRKAGADAKWSELSKLLGEMYSLNRPARLGIRPGVAGERSHGSKADKLVVFTEHRDTLEYLRERVSALLGVTGSVVVIHGGISRGARRQAQDAFVHDPHVLVLLATDAAGEGINLQRAHLMVNYDLPWNPNRLEQRFGRIHRIGQTEVCHLWNLVSAETREGDVYQRLLEKLMQVRQSLGDKVFNVLGKLHFEGHSLRELLIQAVRYGEKPEVKARLSKVVADALDLSKIRQLLETHALAGRPMENMSVPRVREHMERADAHRLQPHYVESFFLKAFQHLGGGIQQREKRRYEITHVPAPVREWACRIGLRQPVPTQYERIVFEKSLVDLPDYPKAVLVCPGHPLLDAVTHAVTDRHRELLERGAVLIDVGDTGTRSRVLFFVEQSIQDGRTTKLGERQIVSSRVMFVEIDGSDSVLHLQYAPYLDYRPLEETDPPVDAIMCRPECDWAGQEIETRVREHVVTRVAPRHLAEVRDIKLPMVKKKRHAVKDRLSKEIAYWDHQAAQIELREQDGRTHRVSSSEARKRADLLQSRLASRMDELSLEENLSSLPPVIVGGAFIVPIGLLESIKEGDSRPDQSTSSTVEAATNAREIVMGIERSLGFVPIDREHDKVGYDIESRVPGTGQLRFIEVKGRINGARSITVTKNEILFSINKPDDYILAIVEFLEDNKHKVHYIREPFGREPDFGVTSVNYHFNTLLERATDPS